MGQDQDAPTLEVFSGKGSSSTVSRTKKKILVIEDDVPTARLFVTTLGKKGYEISSATDGLDGLRLAKAQHPDLVILELFLPGLNGYWISAFLKRNKLYQDIKVLAVSSRATGETHTILDEAEIDNFILFEDRDQTKKNSSNLLEKIDLLLNRELEPRR